MQECAIFAYFLDVSIDPTIDYLAENQTIDVTNHASLLDKVKKGPQWFEIM